MRGRRRAAAWAAAAALLLVARAEPALAQNPAATDPTVQDILAFLVTNQGVQTEDFEKDRDAAEATRATLTTALLSSVATVPISASSGGFTYRLNPVLGTVERASEMFGPFYIERALTAGRGQASIGLTLQYARFTSLDGNDLRDGSFVTVANQFTDEPEPFDVESLTLEMSTRTATLFGNVGVTDRVDVGVAVPLVNLSIQGSRVNNYRGTDLVQARATADVVGFADIALRSKVRLTPADSRAAVAAAVEARLPTGREEDLLGAGELSYRALGIASYEAGRAGVYGNLAYGGGGGGDEVSYGAAVAYAATPRLTIIGEASLRRLEGLQHIIPVVADHLNIDDVRTTRLVPGGEDVTTAFSVVGFKWNVADTWLLHGHVLMPLSENGLTARITPSVALDYSFGR
jgi:hypothetical protein